MEMAGELHEEQNLVEDPGKPFFRNCGSYHWFFFFWRTPVENSNCWKSRKKENSAFIDHFGERGDFSETRIKIKTCYQSCLSNRYIIPTINILTFNGALVEIFVILLPLVSFLGISLAPRRTNVRHQSRFLGHNNQWADSSLLTLT